MNNITVTKPYLPPKEEFETYINQIWENKWLTNNGRLHRQLEEELLDYLNAENLTLTVNGHAALDIAIKGLGLTGEVITTPFTFASTTHAIVMNNLKPVFCDIKKSDMTIDESKIEELITEKTSAILAVHVYGHMCNVEEIDRIAKKHGLKVIYDAAHTFGDEYKNQSLANQGDVSMLSFHATKIFNTIEGGALVYNDHQYTRIFNAYRNFGIEGEETIDYVGGNAKMNEFQAAMGLVNLQHIKELIAERKNITEYYRNRLAESEAIEFFVPERMAEQFSYNYSYMPVILNDKTTISRDCLYNKLKEKSIFARRYFWPIVTEFGCYREEYKGTKLPVAKDLGDRILCLPLYNGLSMDEVDYIVDSVKKILREEKFR